MTEIYFDNSATTRLCSAAREAMIGASFGNPSSLHHAGVLAEKEFLANKRAILDAMGFVREAEKNLIVTSGGTEANNLAVFGTAYAKEHNRSLKIMTDDSEHPSVLAAVRELSRRGFSVCTVKTTGGVLDFDFIEREAQGVFFASFMATNNETGARYDVCRAFEIIRKKSPDAVCHVDAVQDFLKSETLPSGVGADMITVSAHKIGGPRGIGALWISDKIQRKKCISPVSFGGGQEGGLRPGTQNTAGAAAFAAACTYRRATLGADIAHMRTLRQRLIIGLSAMPFVKLHLPSGDAAPHILNIAVPGIKSEVMLRALSAEGVYVSSGSACSSHKNTVSEVLLAFGIAQKEADSSVRISLCPENTEAEADAFLEIFEKCALRLMPARR